MAGREVKIKAVAFSPEGKRVAIAAEYAGRKGKVWLGDVEARTPLGRPLRGHKGGSSAGVFSVEFSPDGKRLTSAGFDGTVRLWDSASGETLGEPLRHNGDYALAVAFSPDGKWLASAHKDATVWLWDMDWNSRACRIAERNLRRDEWQRYLGDEPYQTTCPGLPEPPE